MKQVCWQDIIEEHGSVVWKVAYRLLGNDADAADCFQDVLLATVKLSREQTIRNYPALMVRLATTRAIDRLRQRTREDRIKQIGDYPPSFSAHQTPDQVAQQQDLLAALRIALGQLPSNQAEAFCLKHFQGMSQKQIGRVLGISANAVGVLVHRARVRLEEIMTPNLDSLSEVR
ncbi:RNA polymerase sigma factor [Planctomycetota bacterium]